MGLHQANKIIKELLRLGPCRENHCISFIQRTSYHLQGDITEQTAVKQALILPNSYCTIK